MIAAHHRNHRTRSLHLALLSESLRNHQNHHRVLQSASLGNPSAQPPPPTMTAMRRMRRWRYSSHRRSAAERRSCPKPRRRPTRHHPPQQRPLYSHNTTRLTGPQPFKVPSAPSLLLKVLAVVLSEPLVVGLSKAISLASHRTVGKHLSAPAAGGQAGTRLRLAELSAWAAASAPCRRSAPPATTSLTPSRFLHLKL
jgi:hypothetical protein